MGRTGMDELLDELDDIADKMTCYASTIDEHPPNGIAKRLHEIAEALRALSAEPAKPDVSAMVDRFLGWPLPKGFSPDCGISFDGRKADQWNPNGKGWPIGTNLLSADQARQMFEYALALPSVDPRPSERLSVPNVETMGYPTGDSIHGNMNLAPHPERRVAQEQRRVKPDESRGKLDLRENEAGYDRRKPTEQNPPRLGLSPRDPRLETGEACAKTDAADTGKEPGIAMAENVGSGGIPLTTERAAQQDSGATPGNVSHGRKRTNTSVTNDSLTLGPDADAPSADGGLRPDRGNETAENVAAGPAVAARPQEESDLGAEAAQRCMDIYKRQDERRAAPQDAAPTYQTGFVGTGTYTETAAPQAPREAQAVEAFLDGLDEQLEAGTLSNRDAYVLTAQRLNKLVRDSVLRAEGRMK